MEATDIKIRFSDKASETWLEYFFDTILKFDWDSQAIGISKFRTLTARKGDYFIAQISFYRTKTLRVVFISAKEEFKK